MNPQALIAAFLNNLPLILSVLTALGLWSMAASLIRTFTKKMRELASKTPTKADDVVVGVIAGRLDEVADALDRGDLAEAKRKVGIIKLQAHPVTGNIKPPSRVK